MTWLRAGGFVNPAGDDQRAGREGVSAGAIHPLNEMAERKRYLSLSNTFANTVTNSATNTTPTNEVRM